MDEQSVKNAAAWRKEQRLGRVLGGLREDLYAWSFLSSLNRDHLALFAFQSRRQAVIEENQRALEGA